MEENLVELIKNGNLIVGKIKDFGGFAVFERISLEDALKLKLDELAFATPSMGRGVFRITEDSKIVNIKGVDSHLSNSENASNVLSNSKTQYVITDGSINYVDATHPVNLIIFPGKKADIRIRGTSPLEDLEIEGDVNHRLESFGIKVPHIKQIREYPLEIAKKLGLPIKIKSTSRKVLCDYEEEDRERKADLHKIFGKLYTEETLEGYRPEYISEYFDRLGITDNPTFISFAENNGITVKEFTDYVDSTYSLGQRYGQTLRIVESPFRVSDIEYYVQKNDSDSLERISIFTDRHSRNKKPFEITFASQMGENVARLMNAGWMTENMSHRQDFSILGEMCDDAYFDLRKELDKCDAEIKNNQDDSRIVGKFTAVKQDNMDHFYSQFMHFSSCIKVLQDEMRVRKLPQHQIDNVMNEFIKSFSRTIDFKAIGKSLRIDPKEAEEGFRKMLSSKDPAREMAKARRPNGFIYDEQILLCHEKNNDFYNEMANKVAKSLNLDLDNEFNLIQKMLLLKDDEIDEFIDSRLNFLEENATENREEISFFTVGCSRINGRGESPEVIGYIPSRTNIKKTATDMSSFRLDDKEAYKSLIAFLRKIDPNLIINNGKLCNNNVMRLVQAVLIDYFGLYANDNDRNQLYESKADIDQDDNSFSVKEFKRNNTGMCVERTALAQNLLAFLGYNPMMVYGYLSRENGERNVGHSYNIIIRNGKAILADFSNPIFKDNHFYKTALYPINAETLEHFKKGRGSFAITHKNYHTNEEGEVVETGERRVYSSDEIDPQYFDRKKENDDIDY